MSLFGFLTEHWEGYLQGYQYTVPSGPQLESLTQQEFFFFQNSIDGGCDPFPSLPWHTL